MQTKSESGVDRRQATLNGTVNPKGLPSEYRFEWGKTTSYGNSTETKDPGWEDTTVTAEPKTITGLAPNTTYHYRIVSTNENAETGYGSDREFKTLPAPPLVKTEGVSRIEVDEETGKASLHGQVHPEGFSTHYRFEWGTEEEFEEGKYGHVAPASDVNVGSSEAYIPVEQTIKGLKGLTTYHYRLVAESSEGKTIGVDGSFVTPDWRPIVTTEKATAVATFESSEGDISSQAILNGVVNPQGFKTSYRFEYGTSPASLSFSVPASAENIGSGKAEVKVSEEIEDLIPRTIYYFRLRAENVEGHRHGDPRSFTTPEWAIADTDEPEAAQTSVLSGSSCTSATVCTAVGNYKNSSGTYVTLAQHRNGGAWQIEATPNPSGAQESRLHSVSCVTADECTAVGRYKNSSGTLMTLAQRWDGEGWSIISTPNPAGASESQLESVSCVSATDCTAVGHYKTGAEVKTLVEHYDGASWSIVSSPNPSGVSQRYLYGVSCPAPDDCWAVGRSVPTFAEMFKAAEEGKSLLPQALIEHYDGTSWSIVSISQPPSNLAGVSCPSTSFCMAVVNEGLKLLRFDGSTWTAANATQPPGTYGGTLKAISCTSATACTAVGNHSLSEVAAPLIEHYDGTEWTPHETTDPVGVLEGATFQGSFQSVSCATASACIATGYYNPSFWNQLIVETHPPGSAPTATTEAASNVEAPQVTLRGTVNPNGEDTSYHFEYTDEADFEENGYANATSLPLAPQAIGSATKGIAVAEQVGSLEAGTTYHFRVLAENNQGDDVGEDETFTTP